ncbi:hypothetical protein EW146_g7352 [Bondarzewia mesenterica]|uniref:FAD/NAD(P)-binding domain-containing protein n=1 Tax=Bondarzewia mesenterica TaxID=1095465 RepID=A0A4S4LL56_9AGAM|nr:hypothetical protein EW146_g7352 [Bondarzewia mesenterica]
MSKRNDDRKNVVVVGGGGAGAYIARALSVKLDASKYALTLVTARAYAIHLPAAIRLTTTSEGKLEDTVLIPYDKLLVDGNGDIKFAKVVKIDDHREGGEIALSSGESLHYDVLILAPGSHWDGPLNFPDGKEEIFKHISDWRQKIQKAKGIVLGGGGAVGIEYAGEIKDYWPKKPVTIVQGASQLLNATYPDKYRKRIEKDVVVRGVNVVFNDYVDDFQQSGPIVTRGGRPLDGDLVIPTHGNRPATEFVSSLGSDVLNERGQIKVKTTLQLRSFSYIFAAGDAIEWDEQKQLAKYAKHGDVVVANVLSYLAHTAPSAEYKGNPELIVITNGKNAGVAYFGFLWGIVLGNWFSKMVKSKSLMIDMSRKAYGTGATRLPNFDTISHAQPRSDRVHIGVPFFPSTNMNPTSAYPESSTQNYSESRYSIATTSSLTNASFEGRRGPARPDKKNQFTYKNGRKYHAYGPEKAPYPMSYDREVIDMSVLDHFLVSACTYTISRHTVLYFMDYRDIVDHHVRTKLHHTPTVMDAIETPRRVLDLGCGTGIWSIEAARAWPETEFVGFDLVNIQISLSCLEPSVARRISWQHGNFLSTKLPFEDDSFDHVHIIGIARGVPENKWSSLFEEIHRVLEPDGSVEISEEDIIFPVLPRWFTEPLHAKAQCSSTIQPANGSIHVSIPSPSPLSSPSSQPPHEHALLELLFNSVYESRFINMKPTAPLMPLPEPLAPSQSIESRLERRSSSLARPETPPLTPPSLQSAASSLSLPTSSFSSFSTNNGSDLSMYMSLSLVSDDDDGPDTPTVAHTAATGKSPPKPKMREVDLFGSHRDSASWLSADVDGTKLDSALSRRSSFQKPNLENFSERTRAMSLYRAYIGVLACKEEMWTELKMLRTARLELLSDLGWEKTTSEDQTMEEQDARERFEELFALFESDILTRVSFWYSLTELGYALPRREPLNKSELLEEERMRNAIMDSRAAASEDDFDVPCRILRVFAGFKAYEGEEESFLVDGVE